MYNRVLETGAAALPDVMAGINPNRRIAMERRWAITSLLIAIVCIFFGVSKTAQATNWHVDDNAPGDPGPGNSMISDPGSD